LPSNAGILLVRTRFARDISGNPPVFSWLALCRRSRPSTGSRGAGL